jgi:hypothetical protein
MCGTSVCKVLIKTNFWANDLLEDLEIGSRKTCKVNITELGRQFGLDS